MTNLTFADAVYIRETEFTHMKHPGYPVKSVRIVNDVENRWIVECLDAAGNVLMTYGKDLAHD